MEVLIGNPKEKWRCAAWKIIDESGCMTLLRLRI
jgi:hypothetical protein